MIFKEGTSRETDSVYDVVILIDMQTTFVKNIREGVLPGLISTQTKVLQYCTKKDIPIAVLEHTYDNGKTIPELDVLLQRVPRTKTLLKNKDDGFIDTKLHEVLRSWKATRLLLMGINAEYCVLSTAMSAIRHGYKIITSPNLISGQNHHDPTDCTGWYSDNGSVIYI